jgi:hypothetical protein
VDQRLIIIYLSINKLNEFSKLGSYHYCWISRASRFPRQASRIWKGFLVCDLEGFGFPHCEIERTRENSFPVQAGGVRVSEAEATATADVCVAVIEITNAFKVWRGASDNVPPRYPDQCQSGRVAVARPARVFCTEAIAAAAPQPRAIPTSQSGESIPFQSHAKRIFMPVCRR